MNRIFKAFMAATAMILVLTSAALGEDGTAANAIVMGATREKDYPATISTPMRPGTPNYQFSQINSKWNQPRYMTSPATFSNPHAGVDQYTSSARVPVYPVANAKVAYVDDTSPSGSKSVRLQLDVDGGGYDNVYISYLHLSSVTTTKDAVVTTSTIVGYTGGTHLDWRFQSVISGRLVSIHAYPYMINLAATNGVWNGGHDLDFIALGGYYQNTLTVWAYVKDDGATKEILAGNLVYWWRVHTGLNDAWSGPYNFTKNNYENWTTTLSSTSLGLPSGTKIDVLIRGMRTDQNAPNYKYGWFPAKYNQPPLDPNSDRTTYSHAYILLTLATNSWAYGGY